MTTTSMSFNAEPRFGQSTPLSNSEVARLRLGANRRIFARLRALIVGTVLGAAIVTGGGAVALRDAHASAAPQYQTTAVPGPVTSSGYGAYGPADANGNVVAP
jgi:hypothetical protein